MLIVIPTYRRTNCLHWVLQSLVQCEVESLRESVRVLVVNNYPQAVEEVTSIFMRFSGIKGFSWKLKSRAVSLDPVENWYSAIRDEARDDEMVMLHGDDDLFLPWALVARHRLFHSSKADFLLTDSVGRAFFNSDGNRVWYTGGYILPAEDYRWTAWDRQAPNGPEPSFIGNHVYRANAFLWEGLQRALDACSSQVWSDKRNRELMLPYYLPFAVADVGGKVCQASLACVLRGASADEVLQAPFGVASWNTCYLELLALALFRSGYFGMQKSLQNFVTRRFETQVRIMLPILFDDPRLDRTALTIALREAGLSGRQAFSPMSCKGWCAVVAKRLRMTGLRLRQRMKYRSIAAEQFVQSLALGKQHD